MLEFKYHLYVNFQLGLLIMQYDSIEIFGLL